MKNVSAWAVLAVVFGCASVAVACYACTLPPAVGDAVAPWALVPLPLAAACVVMDCETVSRGRR